MKREIEEGKHHQNHMSEKYMDECLCTSSVMDYEVAHMIIHGKLGSHEMIR